MDVTFYVEDHTFRAHRVIIASQSPFFDRQVQYESKILSPVKKSGHVENMLSTCLKWSSMDLPPMLGACNIMAYSPRLFYTTPNMGYNYYVHTGNHIM